MSEQRMNLVPTDKLVRAMLALEGNEDFLLLMNTMKDRAEGLALWSSLIESETKVRWAQGRVAEMLDWYRLWHGRREFKRLMDARDAGNEL